jgi:hypothetical protein
VEVRNVLVAAVSANPRDLAGRKDCASTHDVLGVTFGLPGLALGVAAVVVTAPELIVGFGMASGLPDTAAMVNDAKRFLNHDAAACLGVSLGAVSVLDGIAPGQRSAWSAMV